MAGRRWDTDITAPVDFYATDWQAAVRRLALEANQQRPPQWIDYFAFSRGLYYKNTPAFVIGRPGWDNWLVWQARKSGARVVDATAVVQAVHQTMIIPTIQTARPESGRVRKRSRTTLYLKADAALQPWKTPRIGLPRKACARTIIIGRS